MAATSASTSFGLCSYNNVTEASTNCRFSHRKRYCLGTWGRPDRQTPLETSGSCRFSSPFPLPYRNVYPSQCDLDNNRRIATTGIFRKQQASVVCCSINPRTRTQHHIDIDATTFAGRRDVLLQTALSAFLHITISSPALALTDAPSEFSLYTDQVNKYNISIPQEWQVGAGETDGFKSITAFYPDAESASNISVVITGLGPDFTRLESFGKVDAFAETLVGGLDRSWQRPPGVAAKLIDSKSANGLYYIEYTLQNPGESRRHIYSAIGMANNGWYNRLYTVTGQFVEDEAEKYSSKIEKAVRSFRFS